MKWIDLVVETSKFELRRDFRIKEVMSIKASVEGTFLNTLILSNYSPQRMPPKYRNKKRID